MVASSILVALLGPSRVGLFSRRAELLMRKLTRHSTHKPTKMTPGLSNPHPTAAAFSRRIRRRLTRCLCESSNSSTSTTMQHSRQPLLLMTATRPTCSRVTLWRRSLTRHAVTWPITIRLWSIKAKMSTVTHYSLRLDQSVRTSSCSKTPSTCYPRSGTIARP